MNRNGEEGEEDVIHLPKTITPVYEETAFFGSVLKSLPCLEEARPHQYLEELWCFVVGIYLWIACLVGTLFELEG